MQQNLPHWNYFRILEKDLEQCFQYVQPTEAHFPVYSDQFAKLILVACSEIENALLALSLAINENSSTRNLGDYRATIVKKYPNFWRMSFSLPRYNLIVKPWSAWQKENTSPDWWKNGYNLIKHDRVGNPCSATLLSAISSVAALEAVLLHLYGFKYRTNMMPSGHSPHLIEPMEEEGGVSGATFSWSWELPDDAYAIQKRTRNGKEI
jgi:hypothetical protein